MVFLVNGTILAKPNKKVVGKSDFEFYCINGDWYGKIHDNHKMITIYHPRSNNTSEIISLDVAVKGEHEPYY